MLFAPFGSTHPPPLVPSPKDIAGCDIPFGTMAPLSPKNIAEYAIHMGPKVPRTLLNMTSIWAPKSQGLCWM